MPETAGRVHLTDDDVAVVLQAIREGRVRALDDTPYDAADWDEETVRDWLERTHLPTRARQIVSTLRGGRQIKSRPVAPTTNLTLRALSTRIVHLERELAALKQRVPDDPAAS
jgi:hypothetical protein